MNCGRPFAGRRAALAGAALGLVGAATTGRRPSASAAPLRPSAAQQQQAPPSQQPNPAAAMSRAPAQQAAQQRQPRAINLRDIGEVDPARLRPGVLFRCSQIYSADVLRELKIRTVVDLRGRAEQKTKGKHRGQGPPPLLRPDEVDALQAHVGDDAPASSSAAAAAVRPRPGEAPPGSPGLESMDLAVTTLRRSNNNNGGGGASASDNGGGSASASASGDEEAGAAGEAMARRGVGAEQAAAGLAEGAADMIDTENFNLIPGKEFGYAMLRMPWRVWRASLGNLVLGRDPRRPFVEAFADEQLLGFTRYYIIILEHAKKNIAAVMRVFARPDTLPALVHCAHGKDRTGVIIMLLLLLCDVPHEAIVADYSESEIELRRYREALGLPDPTGATGAVIPLTDVIIASTAETLRALLAYMDSTYVSVDNYLISCGLTHTEIDAIRRNLLQPGAAAAAPAGSS